MGEYHHSFIWNKNAVLLIMYVGEMMYSLYSEMKGNSIFVGDLYSWTTAYEGVWLNYIKSKSR